MLAKPGRMTTHCIHYGICGGCAVDDRRAIGKPGLLQAALAKAGYADARIEPLIETPLATRRRVDLAATRHGPNIALGLHEARGKTVIDMQECALLLPPILALLPKLRLLLRSLAAFKKSGSVLINFLDHGADILLRMDGEFLLPDRTRIIAFAREHKILRISIAGEKTEPEPVIILAPPTITFAGVAVEPPPGGFLQASREGEAAIIAAVLAGLPRLTAKSRIVELFSGSGTLTFALARHARVEAYEGDAAAAAAAEKAIRAANLAGRISITQRDLHRRPLQASEMAGAAAIVLDPPYAGAAAQMRFCAAAKIPRIVYVSCNPDALARDAAILRHAGYALLTATPIDQFPFSENLESVLIFEKSK